MIRSTLIPLAIAAFVALAPPATAGPIFGSAGSFAVLGGSTVTNTGTSIVFGDVGLYPGSSITGFKTVKLTGTVHNSDAVAEKAQIDNAKAYNALVGLAPTAELTGQDLGGLTLKPGVYSFAKSAPLKGTVTLDAQGNDNAYWVFQIGNTLTTASDSVVTMINTGKNNGSDNGLFWQVGSSATLGTTTDFEGNILALESITLDAKATIHNGRVLAQTGAVMMDTNLISIPSPFPNVGPGLSGGLEFNDKLGLHVICGPSRISQTAGCPPLRGDGEGDADDYRITERSPQFTRQWPAVKVRGWELMPACWSP